MRRFLFSAVCGAVLISTACPRRETAFDYRRAAIDYLQRRMVWRRGERVFVAFDPFGQEEKGRRVTIYGWCLRLGFRLIDQQVVHEDTANLPLAVDFQRSFLTGRIQPTGIRQPKLGREFTASAKRLFPSVHWPRVFSAPPQLAIELRERVYEHYRGLMRKDRYVRKAPPETFANVHRHSDDIYGVMNLRSSYRRILVKSVAGPDGPADARNAAVAPGGRFTAWVDLSRRPRLFFRDTAGGRTFEIVNRTSDWQLDPAWKSDDILVFDQINGFNVFGDGQSYGVHLELDPVARKIVWAAPFGALGFPEPL